MKTRVGVGLLAAAALVLAGCGSSDDSDDAKESVTIGISQLVEHPSLDAAREGFVEQLEDEGYVEGENLEIDYQNAQNDMSNNNSIAQKFVNDDVDLIFAIATPSVQAAANATQDIPILFTAVTDPEGAKIVDDAQDPEANVTGTSDTHPDAVPKTMETIREHFPDSEKVGVIYNSGEQNSVKNVDRAKKAMAENDLEAVEATVDNSSEVKEAANSLSDRVDVIYVPKDNTVVSALDSVVAVAGEAEIPLFAGESDSVEAGAFAGYGFSYNDLGGSTAQMAVDIFDGKDPSDIAVEHPDSLDLIINEDAAKEQGVKLTDEMKDEAELIDD